MISALMYEFENEGSFCCIQCATTKFKNSNKTVNFIYAGNEREDWFCCHCHKTLKEAVIDHEFDDI